MNAIPFSVQVQGLQVVGTLYSPPEVSENPAFILFLHGWAGYRIGPHGMFVEYARKLSQNGYHSLLFDFRGRGFSQGKASDTTFQTMMADLEEVIKLISQTYCPSKIILTGICSGAKLALYYTKKGNYPIQGVVELSSPPLWPGNESQIELKRTKSLIRHYASKLSNWETWKKLVQGNINYLKIFQMISHSAKRSLSFYDGEKLQVSNNDKKESGTCGKFSGKILMIHGEKDPETSISTKQIISYLEKQGIGYDVKVIKGGNHSFYGIPWKNEIGDAILQYANSITLQLTLA